MAEESSQEIDAWVKESRERKPRPWEPYWRTVDYLLRVGLRRDATLPTDDVKF